MIQVWKKRDDYSDRISGAAGFLIGLILLMSVLIAAGAADANAQDLDTVEAMVQESCTDGTVEILESENQEPDRVLKLTRLSDGKEYVTYFYFLKSKPGVLYCVFYGDPDGFSIAKEKKSDFLDWLNNLNASQNYPTIFLSQNTYPAGHAHLIVSNTQSEGIQEFITEILTQTEELFSVFSGSEYFTETDPAQKQEETEAAEKKEQEETEKKEIVETEKKETVETEKRQGHWVYDYVDQVCPECFGSKKCSLCHGTGVYRLYGVSVDCPKECSYCGGTGYVSVLQSSWVWDE